MFISYCFHHLFGVHRKVKHFRRYSRSPYRVSYAERVVPWSRAVKLNKGIHSDPRNIYHIKFGMACHRHGERSTSALCRQVKKKREKKVTTAATTTTTTTTHQCYFFREKHREYFCTCFPFGYAFKSRCKEKKRKGIRKNKLFITFLPFFRSLLLLLYFLDCYYYYYYFFAKFWKPRPENRVPSKIRKAEEGRIKYGWHLNKIINAANKC